MHYRGIGVEKRPQRAIRFFTRAANRGNAHAQYLLGKHYLENQKNIPRALGWLIQAANNGHLQAEKLQ